MGNFCSNCGAPMEPNVKFCSACGTSTAAAPQTQVAPPSNVSQTETAVPKKKTSKLKTGCLIATLVAIGSFIVFLMCIGLFMLIITHDATPLTLYDIDFTLREDEHIAKNLTLSGKSQISITCNVIDGVPIECVIFDDINYERYLHSPLKAKPLGIYKFTTESVTFQKNVEAGEYKIVFDNSDYGSVQPPWNFQDDIVKAHAKITMRKSSK